MSGKNRIPFSPVNMPVEVEKEKISPKKKEKRHIKVGVHAVKNIVGHATQKLLFDDDLKTLYENDYGVTIPKGIDRYGVELNDEKLRVLEGVLKGFTIHDYQGNIEPLTTDQIRKEFNMNIPALYEGIKKFPKLKVTQSELLRWCGYDSTAHKGSKMRCLENFLDLGTKDIFCFKYERLEYDDKGKPIKELVPATDTGKPKERYKKVTVRGYDTVFKINTVHDVETDKFKYYEIRLSPAFISQINDYFLMIPDNWRDEIKEVLGTKKGSRYLIRFLYFLSVEFDRMRRHKVKIFKIERQWKSIAMSLNFPDSQINRKKGKTNEILLNCYEDAEKMGYLKKFKRDGFNDTLYLNEEKFFNPKVAKTDKIPDEKKSEKKPKKH